MKRMKTQKYHTTRRVAEYLSLTPATITRWCRQGKFPNAKKIGRVWRIPTRDVRSL